MRRIQAGPGLNSYRAAGGCYTPTRDCGRSCVPRSTNTFRMQMDGGFLPSENSIDHAGCFGKYQFETGFEKERLFSTIYTSAYSPDPISGQMEHYICVGMNSCKDGAGAPRAHPCSLV